jgi:hypothetical protein
MIVCWAIGATAHAQSTVDFNVVYPLPNFPGYPPEEMVANCGGVYPDAAAMALFTEGTAGNTSIEIHVSGAVPNTLFTAWLRLGPGGSPLTGAGSTPLANPSEIVGLGAATPAGELLAAATLAGLVGDDGTGDFDVANGFVTDSNGEGTFRVDLSFAVEADAVYPFSEFDPSIPDTLLGESPFAIRVVSHCTDNIGHGLSAGKREAWFDLTAFPVPEPSSAGLMAFASCSLMLVRHRRQAG